MVEILKNYVNGQWQASKSKETIDVYNPATKEVIAKVPVSTRKELDEAAKIAHEAFQEWKEVAVPKRARLLFKLQQLLTDNREVL
ncbi:hypothetical protein NS53R_03645, partial [Mammaliicoccus sciuri]